MVGDELRENFLVGVANAYDKQPASKANETDVEQAFLKRHVEFMRLCSRYLPRKNDETCAAQQKHYRYARRWWKTERESQLEQGNPSFGLHLAILRQKLRLIWEVADAGDKARAKRKAEQASVELLQLARDIRCGTTQDPYVRLSSLLGWLRDRVGRLKICENPECATGRTYFFSIYPNDRYCSAVCVRHAKELRQEQRESARPPKTYKRSEESRERMSESATRRWVRERAKTGRKKYD